MSEATQPHTPAPPHGQTATLHREADADAGLLGMGTELRTDRAHKRQAWANLGWNGVGDAGAAMLPYSPPICVCLRATCCPTSPPTSHALCLAGSPMG